MRFCLAEKASTVEATGKMWDKGELVERSEFSSETEVKLVRYNAVRYIHTSLYHHMISVWMYVKVGHW